MRDGGLGSVEDVIRREIIVVVGDGWGVTGM